jgi:hypothetical protein
MELTSAFRSLLSDDRIKIAEVIKIELTRKDLNDKPTQ